MSKEDVQHIINFLRDNEMETGHKRGVEPLEEMLKENTELNKNNDWLRKELKEQNLENQALYESINCNDNNMLAREYEKLKKENEELKEYKKLLDSTPKELLHKVFAINQAEIVNANDYVSKKEYEKLQKEITKKQIEIDTAEEVLKWKGKYHLLSRKINGVLEDKIKDKAKFLDKNIELQWASTSYNEIDIEKYQYAKEILEDLLKE